MVSGDYYMLLKRRALSMMKLAERLLSEGEYDLAVLNAEYAAQLYAKAVIYRLSGEEWRGRSVRALLGVIAFLADGEGLTRVREVVAEFVRRKRRLLAELEEAHTRSLYGPLTYSKDQAEAIVNVAKEVVKLLENVENLAFSGG